jgi:hypothetical protein
MILFLLAFGFPFLFAFGIFNCCHFHLAPFGIFCWLNQIRTSNHFRYTAFSAQVEFGHHGAWSKDGPPDFYMHAGAADPAKSATIKSFAQAAA